jgi:hypothetical protein
MFFAILAVPAVRAWAGPGVVQQGKGRKVSNAAVPAAPWLAGAGAVAALVTVVVSASRAAALALAVVLVMLAVLEAVRFARLRRVEQQVAFPPKRTMITFYGVAASVAIICVLAFPLLAWRVLGLTPLAAETVNDRGLMFRAAVDVGLQHPVLGVGPGGFVDSVPTSLGADWYSTVGPDVVLTSPHNWVLQAVVAGGFLLGAVAVAFALGSFIVGLRRWHVASASGGRQLPDLLAGAGLALLGYGVALLTHFTSPGTTVFAALLLGVVLALPARPAGRSVALEALRWGRTVAFGTMAVYVAALSFSEVSLAEGVSAAAAGNVSAAQASFTSGIAVRPWDADASGIAAQSFAQAAEAQIPGAAELAVQWATSALSATPTAISAAKALAVGQQYSGDLNAAESTLAALAARVPFDSAVALRHGAVLVLMEDFAQAEKELLRAAGLSPLDPSPWQALEYLYSVTGDARDQLEAHEKVQALMQH